jgi:hypothetical protein
MANEQSRAPPAMVSNSDAEARPDERTPLLGQEAAQPSSNEAVAGAAFSENIRRQKRRRLASITLAFVLVSTIVILTLLFGGPHALNISPGILETAL